MVSSFLRSYPCLQKAQKWIKCRKCVKNALCKRGSHQHHWGMDEVVRGRHADSSPPAQDLSHGIGSANTGTTSGESGKRAAWQMAARPHFLLINQNEGWHKCTKQLLVPCWLHRSCHKIEERKEGWGSFVDLHHLQTQIYKGVLLSPS